MATKVLSDVIPDLVSHLKDKELKKNPRLIENRNGSLLLWSEADKYLYSTPSLTSNLKNSSFQTLITSISPVFDITALKSSPSFQYALVYGSNGIGVIELPRKYGDEGQFEGGKSTIHCRFTILDESYFTHHITTKIIEVAWYPGSPNDTHIVALTSDNCLRFYDITMPDQPMMRLPLFDNPHDMRTVSSFASVTGDLAVDFDIGLPSVDEAGVASYPIYIMQESGDVWALYCKFTQNRLVVEMQGPLTMNPPAADNYGCNYCSILCLPSSPVTVAMATQMGTVHHCLVLACHEDEEEYGDLNLNPRAHREDLYVYESIQLNLNWVGSDSDDADSEPPLQMNHIKALLNGDHGYITVSEGGLHSVLLPWLNDLSNFLQPQVDSEPEISSPAEVSYVLCTHPSDKCPALSVCGCTVVQQFAGASTLVVLLSTGELVYTNINSPVPKIQSEFDHTVTTTDENYTSPLRKLHGCGGFDSYIAKILTKNATVPVIRSGGADQTIPADVYYKLLTKTTQVLHEEYLAKMVQVKLELQKRCKILYSKKEEQMKEITLLNDNSNLIEKGDELANKLETAQENMQSLYERIVAIPRAMQNSAPVLSKEEEEWGKELDSIKEKMVRLRRTAEVVKKKNDNSVLQSVPERSSTLTKSAVLTTAQGMKFRAHLKDQEQSISQLVECVENLKLKSGVR